MSWRATTNELTAGAKAVPTAEQKSRKLIIRGLGFSTNMVPNAIISFNMPPVTRPRMNMLRFSRKAVSMAHNAMVNNVEREQAAQIMLTKENLNASQNMSNWPMNMPRKSRLTNLLARSGLKSNCSRA